MNALRKPRIWLTLAAILGIVLLCVGLQVLHTILSLRWARASGVYQTPQEGVIDRANRWYCGVEKVEIEQAATNSFDGSDPHVWYVIWRVYARSRAPCDMKHPGEALAYGSYEGGGNYYLDTRDGWVYMPEGRLPELVGLWMKVLGLAGPGDPTHVPRN